ncbi:MAG: squalene synthase HpnC [Ignavibacteriales bacterium]|nr:squalene synthase HpnC [Ignavibacteriales bacterium]
MELDLASGYNGAIEMASSHYENFPVISLAVPKLIRKDIAIIYWFARTADDIADEGSITQHERLVQLQDFRNRFIDTLNGKYRDNHDAALHFTICERKLKTEHFFALLSAFEQDIEKCRYSTLEELFDYCNRSANPVGRLLLQLYNVKAPQTANISDAICTALQLANFWQDISIDNKKGRIYIPQDYLQKYGITEEEVLSGKTSENFVKCMAELTHYTDSQLTTGFELIPHLPGAFRWQILWTILGGRKILAKIKKNKYNVFRKRVKLSVFNISQILIDSYLYERAICKRNSKKK